MSLDLAMGDARSALRLGDENPVAYYVIGLAWHNKGDLKEAQNNLEKAIQLKPDYAAAYCSLGVILGEQGDRKRAAEALDKAVAISPELTDARYDRGVFAYAQQGQYPYGLDVSLARSRRAVHDVAKVAISRLKISRCVSSMGV